MMMQLKGTVHTVHKRKLEALCQTVLAFNSQDLEQANPSHLKAGTHKISNEYNAQQKCQINFWPLFLLVSGPTEKNGPIRIISADPADPDCW